MRGCTHPQAGPRATPCPPPIASPHVSATDAMTSEEVNVDDLFTCFVGRNGSVSAKVSRLAGRAKGARRRDAWDGTTTFGRCVPTRVKRDRMTSWSTFICLPVKGLVHGRLCVSMVSSCVLLACAVPGWARAAPVGASAAESGSLSVRVVGLPLGQSVHGVLHGPDGLKRSVSAPRLTIPKARPGLYKLTLRPVRISRTHGPIQKGAIARPVLTTTSVRVRVGHHANLVGRYGSIINPGVKTLTGGLLSATGSAEDPMSVVLSGHQTFTSGVIISMPPSVQLPRGLLSHVVAVSYHAGNTMLSLHAASIYEVAPNFQFNVPLQASQATAADFSASCGLPSGLSPYRRIKNVSFSGGWSTADVFGVHVTDGVRADVHFTVEAGIEVTAGAGLSCSLSLAFYASGMAGPIPVTAGIEGDLTGSAAVGGILDSGGSIEVNAGGHTIGFPPAMLLIPDVSFANPHFTLSAKRFAHATAGIGLTVKAGVGVGGVASLTLNVGSSLNFTAQPGSCLWDAKFGQFSAEGELLDWHLSTPQTPALFTKQLGGNFCASSGSGTGTAGSGGSGADVGPNPPGGGGASGGGNGPGGGGGGNNPGGGSAATVAGGYDTTCALLLAGGVDCWGGNISGELGNGTSGEGTSSLTPTSVLGISNATALAVGAGNGFGDHACAVLATGVIDCWGSNNSGQLGVGSTTGPDNCEIEGGQLSEPCSTSPIQVHGITNAVDVAADLDASCAVLATGAVECWGSGYLGQLGTGVNSVAASPVPMPVAGIDNAVQISMGEQVACVVLRTGSVDCWGPGGSGQLGDGWYGQDECGIGIACNLEPSPVSNITDATQVSVGPNSVCAVLSTGHVECWGNNGEGALGDGAVGNDVDCLNDTSCVLEPVLVKGLANATRVTVGAWHSCASLNTGGVDCWGENTYGQLGNGTTTGADTCSGQPCTPYPVTVSGIETATTMGAGWWWSCSVLSSGGIDCWGQGVLGSGNTEDSDVPVSVSGI